MKSCSSPDCDKSLEGKDYRAKYCSRSCAATVNNSMFPKRGDGAPRFCKACDSKLRYNQINYCSRGCGVRYRRDIVIENWLAGKTGGSDKNGILKGTMRRYLIDQAGNKCTECNWSVPNPVIGKPILTVDHIDGNWKNNNRDNLKVLCYNCHTLTSTFGALNKNGLFGDRPGSFRKSALV